jgi:apolipoprotein N-acyltransferase
LIKPPIELTKRVKIGLALIYLAGFGWVAELIIPFTHIPYKGVIWVIVLSIAEASFLVGLAILGKPAYKQIKLWLMEQIKRPPRP